ncbi:platelet-activating factor acetylhydrolase-like isoform X2 [Cylas formicarius]|nr:platelet-activating factor acetylhydrolase-like isoform X2 [Cylas formicarius]
MLDVMFDYTKEGPFVRFYYPTRVDSSFKDQSKTWIQWLPHDNYLVGIARVIMLYSFLLRIVFWWSDGIKIPAQYGAKPRTEEKLKCVIMSHGLGANRFFYSNICCELASRGFLVVALEHKDQSACYTYYFQNASDAENDRKINLEFRYIKFGRDHYEKRNEQLKVRAAEFCAVLDYLIGLQRGEAPRNIMRNAPDVASADVILEDFAGHLDLDSVTVMGHSFGAATALYALSIRKEFKQGILLDPWMFPVKGERLEEKVRQPLLFVNTQTFHIGSNVDAMAKMLTNADSEIYTIRHTTHESQTDSVLLIGYWLNWFMKKLDPLQALRINNCLILRFLNKTLGYPGDVRDCVDYLKVEEKENVERGLTKPWA